MPVKTSKKSSQYWEQMIADFSSQTKMWLEGYELPAFEMEQDQNSFFVEKIPLTATQLTQLKKFAKTHDLSLVSIFHAAFGLLLNRYSGSDDIIYGDASFAENGKGLKIISPILPFRSLVHDDETILSYLKKLHATLEDNKKHANSYEFSVNENFRYLFIQPAEKVKKTAEKLDFDSSKFPLVLNLQKLSPFKMEFLFNQFRFNQHNADILIQHFMLIIDKIVNESDVPVTHFSILTKEEKKILLNDWKKSAVSCKNGTESVFIPDWFAKQVQAHPEYPAIVYNEKTLTYKQLDDLSNQIANLLLNKKVKQGDTVAVFMERTPALFATMMAIFKIGAIYVPINPKYPDERIKFILKDCDTHVIIVNNTQRIPQEYLYKTVMIDDHYNAVKAMPKQKPNVTLSAPDLVAYVIYTSGTTGQPKGVMIKHESLINLTQWYKSCFAINNKDRASQFGSQGFDSFFCETIPFLLVGASIHIVEDDIKLTPSLFLPWLANNKITVLDLPTSYSQILLNMSWPDSKIRLVKIGGEALSFVPTQQYTFDIWNIYGPTESTVEATFVRIFQANVAPDKQPLQYSAPPIGKPIANSEVYIVDQHLVPVPMGCAGELLIGGVNISPGYLNRPQLTRERFIRNVFSNDPNAKLYRTGDLVRWLSDGNLEFLGRVDHQIKIRGFRIELNEIETAINQYPDVNEVVVLAKELINGQKTLIAYLVPNIDKIRIPFQERCLLEMSDLRYGQVLTEDISREGVAIHGLIEPVEPGTPLKLSIKLPGTSEGQWLTGKLIWQIDQRAGVMFDKTDKQMKLLKKAIEYYLSSRNLMETLQGASAKRNLRKALSKKLPDYMVPSVFTILPQFPLTFNGKIDWKALPPPQDFERLLERSYVAPRNETERKIADIWSEVLQQKEVSITDNFFDLGGNSILVAQLSVRILQEFDVSIPAKILFDLPFIPIIGEYIDSKGEKYTYQSSIQEEINRDEILQDDLIPHKKLSKHIDNPQGILLTGAAGFLGIYLLRELLANTDAKIFCLIRKGEFESVAKRLTANVDRYELGDEISLSNRRIVIIPSDIGLDQFGLPMELYNNLCDKVDVIYHCGAQVNTMAAYTNLRTSNVQGTIEVIKFALQKFDKPIHYISTLSAASKLDENGNYAEEFPEAEPNKLVGGYAISKWVSERLLVQAKNRGLPVCIYRSGYILGQSNTGIMNINDALLLLIKGCIQLGFAPDWHEKVLLLPVDFVSKAVVNIAKMNPTKSGVFHLDHPRGLMWTDLIAWLDNYGYNIKLCSHQEWLKQLSLITADNALYPFLPHYLSQKEAPQTPDPAMANAMHILQEVDLKYPEIDDTLLRTYMDYLCNAGFFPSPQNKKIVV